MTPLLHIDARCWDLADVAPAGSTPVDADAPDGVPRRADWLGLLEDGGVLVLPRLPFDALSGVPWLLDAQWADPAKKNIAFDAAGGAVRGLSPAALAAGAPPVAAAVTDVLAEFNRRARMLVAAIAPGYGPSLRWAQASLRLQRVEGRVSSWRKDDSRLHVDAFPSRPNGGERILRVFRNVNPHGEPRVWRVGDRYEAVARRFAPAVPRYSPLRARLLRALKVTKSVRSPYDHTMMHLHDLMKADADYQRSAPQQTVAFAPGTTWVCFSDQTSHAVMSGQFMLEQTANLPVAAMAAPAKSPLAVIESLRSR